MLVKCWSHQNYYIFYFKARSHQHIKLCNNVDGLPVGCKWHRTDKNKKIETFNARCGIFLKKKNIHYYIDAIYSSSDQQKLAAVSCGCHIFQDLNELGVVLKNDGNQIQLDSQPENQASFCSAIRNISVSISYNLTLQ